MADIYPDGPEVDSDAASSSRANVYATVAMTSSPPTTDQGVRERQPGRRRRDETIAGRRADTLRFFKDNDDARTTEESAGAVSCIRVYQRRL